MEYFSTEKAGRTFVLRLDQGDYVVESIEALAQEADIKDAVVTSGIGTLDQCTLHMVTTTGYPSVLHFEKWKDTPLELASVDGVIADGKPHLHAVVADSKKAYAGHLERGCRVLYLAEIVIVEMKSMDLTRIRNEKNILKIAKKSSTNPEAENT